MILPNLGSLGATSLDELYRQREELSHALAEANARFIQTLPNGRDYIGKPDAMREAIAELHRRLGLLQELYDLNQNELERIADAMCARDVRTKKVKQTEEAGGL